MGFLIAFAIAVVRQTELGEEAEDGEVLPDQVGSEHVILAQAGVDIVETAVGVLLHPPEPGQVVLVDIVVAGTEQAHAELVILEQEAAEIGIEWLDADTDAVEVVAWRDITQVLVEECLLYREMAVIAGLAAIGVDFEKPVLLGAKAVVLLGQGEAVFVVGWAEDGVALVVHEGGDHGLGEHALFTVTDQVIPPALLDRRRADRDRKLARFENRVGAQFGVEEPVIVDRAVGLQRVDVVGVIPRVVDFTEVVEDAPAVGDRVGFVVGARR